MYNISNFNFNPSELRAITFYGVTVSDLLIQEQYFKLQIV